VEELAKVAAGSFAAGGLGAASDLDRDFAEDAAAERPAKNPGDKAISNRGCGFRATKFRFSRDTSARYRFRNPIWSARSPLRRDKSARCAPNLSQISRTRGSIFPTYGQRLRQRQSIVFLRNITATILMDYQGNS
jgi:hypothetical protein